MVAIRNINEKKDRVILLLPTFNRTPDTASCCPDVNPCNHQWPCIICCCTWLHVLHHHAPPWHFILELSSQIHRWVPIPQSAQMQHLQVLILKMPRFLSMKSDTSFNIIWPQSSSFYKKKIKNTLSVRSFSILISCDFKTTFCDLLKKK